MRACTHIISSDTNTDWMTLFSSCVYMSCVYIRSLAPIVVAACPDFEKTVLFSDECSLARDVAFDIHNKHVSASVNPHAHHRWFSINIWSGIIDNYLKNHIFCQNVFTRVNTSCFSRRGCQIFWRMFLFISGCVCGDTTIELPAVLGGRYNTIWMSIYEINLLNIFPYHLLNIFPYFMNNLIYKWMYMNNLII